jgi:hypothetical protein
MTSIEVATQNIINEVKKYAAEKNIVETLSFVYIEDEDKLQNKTIDELVIIYNKSFECLHKHYDYLSNLHDYTRVVRNLIFKKTYLIN